MDNKFTKSLFAFLFTFCVMLSSASAQQIFIVVIKDDIGQIAWRTVNLAHQKATELKAATFLIELNTFGGAVNFADSTRSKLLGSDMHTVVYINNNAASAGALISLASDEIFMQKGGSMGAASVVN